jgi:type I site-specific restriction endonuclease
MFRFTGGVWSGAGFAAAFAWLLAAISLAQAQPTSAQGIYTCVDAQGRKLTSDRPIAACTDREQQVLNPSGTLKSRVGPTLTAQERIQIEAREKAELEEQARLNEEKRRDRALLTRYPNKSVHEGERSEALAQIGVVRQASVNRVEELQRQRKLVTDEMEFYKKDPNKAPPSLRRQVDDVAHSLSVQSRFIADQDAEIKRVNDRFDEELQRLKQLWAQQSPVAPATNKKR